jgi:hypothetical protein
MRTITENLFTFQELSYTAKENAIREYRNSEHDYSFYFDEITESVKAVIELFDLKTGREYSDIRTSHIDDVILELSGARLYAYLVNNYGYKLFFPSYIRTIDGRKNLSRLYFCKYFKNREGQEFTQIFSKWKPFSNSCTLTGVCYDNDILEPIYEFLKKPTAKTTFRDLIGEIQSSISKCYQNTEEWINSEEFIIDELEANEYEFTYDGKIYF